MKKRYVGPQEMAAILHMSIGRLLDKARRGEVPSLKLSKGAKARRRFDPEAVIKALQANMSG